MQMSGTCLRNIGDMSQTYLVSCLQGDPTCLQKTFPAKMTPESTSTASQYPSPVYNLSSAWHWSVCLQPYVPCLPFCPCLAITIPPTIDETNRCRSVNCLMSFFLFSWPYIHPNGHDCLSKPSVPVRLVSFPE